MKFMKSWLTLILLFPTLATAAPGLRPFATDGCTLSPDGTPRNRTLWRECCVAHDLRLWGGGTKTERLSADEALFSCVEKKAGRAIAKVFLAGVRVGSYSPYKIPAKVWGNAWYDRSGYRALPESELLQLLDELARLDLPEDIREAYRLELEARRNLP
jgi:hypothetical protein